jgi:hypothetical protein
MASKLTERLALTGAGIKMSEETDFYKKWAATTRQGNIRKLAFNKKILKKKRSLSCQTSVLEFFKLSHGTCASPPVRLVLDNGDDEEQYLP